MDGDVPSCSVFLVEWVVCSGAPLFGEEFWRGHLVLIVGVVVE